MSDDVERRDLVARLQVANDRMRRLRAEADRADNVIRFRVERHLEAAEETLVDLNVKAIDLPPAGTYARRHFERGLRRLESEIVFAEAKFEAAWAEENRDGRRFVRATDRAMNAQRSALSAEVAPRPPEGA
jgi:hypothetical protein